MLVATGAAAAPALAQDSPEVEQLAELSIEELSRLEITSVSKRAEPLNEAAAAVFVITNDDIRRSGMLSIPEALRLAPNLQVARIDALDYAISARGFNGFETANKLLVLIDGRSVYTPLYSGVEWDQHHLPLEDIDRIEVISGPGGTLWGANAVNGVINITSRPAQDTQGALFSVQAGTLDSSITGRFGTRIGATGAARVYATAFKRGPMRELDGSEANDDWDGLQGGFRADFGEGADTFTLQGDVFDNTIEESLGLSGYAQGGNLLARWRRSLGEDAGVSLQAYYDRAERVARGIYSRLDTLDVQAQHTFAWGARHRLVWGAGYRRTEDDFRNFVNAFVLDPPSEEISLADVFVQDQVALGPDLTLTAGLKLEHNSYTGLEYLPNLRLAWRPAPDTLLWGSVSRVVRNPSRIERDLVIPGVLVGGVFQPEELTAWEAGVRARPLPTVSVSVNVYLHEYDRLRSNESTPVTFLPVFVGNTLRGRTYGVEAWGDLAVTGWWRLSAGFTTIGKDFEREPGSRDISGMEAVGFDPEYVLKLRSQMTLSDRLELDLRLRALAETPAAPSIGYVGAPAYVTADARLGWRVTERIELSVTGLNLFDENHREAAERRAREVPRSVHAGLRWRY